MSFIPINVYDEDIIQDAEEHTRELQIEEGYAVFQKALKCQKDCDFKKARGHYDVLFEIDVMKLEVDLCPPAAHKLRYLASKNYCILLLKSLKETIGSISKDEAKEALGEVLFELSEALTYDPEDPSLLETIYLFSDQLGFNREARLALEGIIYSDLRVLDIEDAFKSGGLLMPQDYKFVLMLREFLEKIGDEATLRHSDLMQMVKSVKLNPHLKIVREDYAWLKTYDFTDSYQSFIEKENNRQIEVVLTSKDWLSIFVSMNDKLWSLTKMKRKMPFEDVYGYSDKSAPVVKFQLPHGLEDRPTDQKPEEPHPPDKTVLPEELSKKRRRKSEFDGHRQSKRVKAMDQPLGSASSSLDEDEFFDQINRLLALAEVKFVPVLPAFNSDDYIASDAHLVDFKSLLLSWDDNQSEIFLRKDIVSSAKSNKQPLMQMLDFAALGDNEITKPKESSIDRGIDSFLEMLKEKKLHIQEARILALKFLLTSQNGKISVLEDVWQGELLKLVTRTVESTENVLYAILKGALENTAIEDLEMAQGVAELFAHAYLSLEKDSRTSSKSIKEKKETEYLISSLKSRMHRWLGIVGDMVSLNDCTSPVMMPVALRHEWTMNLTAENPTISLQMLKTFRDGYASHASEVSIDFPNFTTIPTLSLESITTQISKFEAASVFSKVFEVEIDEDDDKDTAPNRISILESILIPEEDQESALQEDKAISQFMSSASLEFRLQLWCLLLDAYDANGQGTESFNGYLRIFISTIDEFHGKAFEESTDHVRTITMLRSLNICLDISRKLVTLSMQDGSLVESLAPDLAKKALSSMLRLLRLLRVYVLLDDAIINNAIQAPSHPSWDKAARQFKELVVRSWALLFYFYKKCLPEEMLSNNIICLNDILSMIHEEVGSRYYCSIGDGFFLQLCLKEISKIESSDTELDMLQCLHCRYGFTLGHEPYDHHTTPVDLNKQESMELIGFIMKVVLSKRNILQHLQRSDVRAVLEELHDSLGDPDSTHLPSINQNKDILANFFSRTTVTPDFIQNALAGRLDLPFCRCDNEIGTVGKSGFYYIQGLTHLTQYKQKAKQNNGKYDDVEGAIEYFTYDLMCNTNRFESWFGLAESYDSLANLDLSMSADKINSPDLRKIPSAHQRQSILACCMAVSVYLQTRAAAAADGASEAASSKLLTSHYQQQLAMLWPFFASVLFQASRSPMNMEAYTYFSEKVFYSIDGVLSSGSSSRKTMSQKMVWRVADEALKIALNSRDPVEPEDWSVFLLRAKVLSKLTHFREALECIAQAVRLSDKDNHHNNKTGLDAPYKLVSMAYKYVFKELLDVEEVWKIFKSATPFTDGFELEKIEDLMGLEDTVTNRFYCVIVKALLKVKHMDKQKDLHRPSFRLAKVYDQAFSKADLAKEQLSAFFNKGLTGTLPIRIWRHESERPGQHYEFMYEYIVYYNKLLEQTQDTPQLAILMRRLRRYNGSMVNRADAWDNVCHSTARTVKAVMGIEDGYSDAQIAILPSEHFETVTTKMFEDAENHKWAPSLEPWLLFADDKKKLNNGLGSTSALDDLFVCVFLKVYREYLESHSEFVNIPWNVAFGFNTTNTNAATTPVKGENQPTTQVNSPASVRDTSDVNQTPPPQSLRTPSEVTPELLIAGQVHIPSKMRVTRKLIMTKARDFVKILSSGSDGKKAAAGAATAPVGSVLGPQANVASTPVRSQLEAIKQEVGAESAAYMSSNPSTPTASPSHEPQEPQTPVKDLETMDVDENEDED